MRIPTVPTDRKQKWAAFAAILALVVGVSWRATSDVAALAGWDDPRTRRRVSGLVGAQATLDAASEPVFEHFHRSATKTALAADLEITLASLSCTKRCIAKLDVKNTRDEAIAWKGSGAPRTYVATKRGGPRFFEPGPDAPDAIPAATTVPVTVTLPEGFSANEPAILGICGSGRCSALVLR